MKAQAYLKIEVELDKIDFNDVDFKTLSLDEKKKMLIETLDKNALYVNLSDIDDEELSIDAKTKKLNSFFKRGE
jgi:adenine-specific DNA-methyltransferase